MSNLYSRRLIRAGQRYKLTIVRPTMFDLECWEGQGKSRFYPTPSLWFFFTFSHTLGKNFFLSPGFSLIRSRSQTRYATLFLDVRWGGALRDESEETCLCMYCKHFVRLCPTSFQRWVTMSSHMSLPNMSENAGHKTWVEWGWVREGKGRRFRYFGRV